MQETSIRVEFLCSLCGAQATELILFPDRKQVQVQSFMGNLSENLNLGTVFTLWDALSRRDPAAIYALDRLWIPCYCADCRACYCEKHWMITPEWDEDLPDFYDCAWGECPQGHRRLIDD